MPRYLNFFLVFIVPVGAVCARSLPEVGDGTSPGGTTSTGDVTDDGSTAATTVADTGETGITPGCGNGVVEAGETCDDAGESATCDVDCTEVVCGDSIINATAGEECEGENLGGGSCQELGFDGGDLSCGSDCAHSIEGCAVLPAAPELWVNYSPVKHFDFEWRAVARTEYYRLWESAFPGDSFAQVGEEIVGEAISLEVPLHLRFEASYVLQACNAVGCTDSAVVDVMGSLAEAVGYFKASNVTPGDVFGFPVALSSDGNTLAVGAHQEDSNTTGINGNQSDESATDAGAVYVYLQDELGQWSQQAYIKASNAQSGDQFGWSVSLSNDGNTLVVGAVGEDSADSTINGDQYNDEALDAGAAYVFIRNAMGQWSQQAYLKASNADYADRFGYSVALNSNGDTLAVGADHESSGAVLIGGDETDNSATYAGAVYLFTRDAMGQWSQQEYVKASNAGTGDWFGYSIALSGDGDTLAVGALFEDSMAAGTNGSQGDDDDGLNSGAAYVFVRNALDQWSQQAYLKASNTGADDRFGISVALSGDGNILAVGSHWEDSNANGVGGNETDDSATHAGAVYLFERNATGQWSQGAYVKASNSNSNDVFGGVVALAGEGNILAVAARQESSGANGIDGDQTDDSVVEAGAVYVFVHDQMGQWWQQAYVKAPNTGSFDQFGGSVALSGDGATLAVGTHLEDGSAIGIGGNQIDDTALNSGAVYLY